MLLFGKLISIMRAAPESNEPIHKLLSDHLYGKLLQNYESMKYIESAGFFFDSTPDDETHIQDSKFFCTPVHKLQTTKFNVEKPVILLSTGSFSPLHDGHIHMMERAKEILESKGYSVVGGYLSPSHDEYVSSKDGGLQHFSIINAFN